MPDKKKDQTRKSSSVNAIVIPTTVHQVIHLLSYPGGYPRWLEGVPTLAGGYLPWPGGVSTLAFECIPFVYTLIVFVAIRNGKGKKSRECTTPECGLCSTVNFEFCHFSCLIS